jgi:hypothetical protein
MHDAPLLLHETIPVQTVNPTLQFVSGLKISSISQRLVNAHWYVPNATLHNDLSIPYVAEVIRAYAEKHKNRTTKRSNELIRNLFNQSAIARRLNRMWPEDLTR